MMWARVDPCGPLRASSLRSARGSPPPFDELETRAAIQYTRDPMPTSVHIPKPLLEAVDRRAKVLKISRNRLIVRALEREIGGGGGWSEGFFDRLGRVDAETVTAADEMLSQIRSSRSSKAPREL